MYAIRDSEGRFVARSGNKAGAHRLSRSRKHLGASVNRVKAGADTSVIVAMIGAGSLYGGSTNSQAYNPRYWLPLRLEHEPYALFEVKVPNALAKKLEVHGTPEQEFDDGYKGWRAVAPYLKKTEPFYVSHSYSSEGPIVWDPKASTDEDA